MTFAINNWTELHEGQYKLLKDQRPVVNYKELLTEEIVASNVPDLTKDEELMTRISGVADRINAATAKSVIN